MVHHSGIFVSLIALKCFYLENKAIPNPNFKLTISVGSQHLYLLQSLFLKGDYSILIPEYFLVIYN